MKKLNTLIKSKKKHFGVFLTNYKKYKIIDCVNFDLFIQSISKQEKIENYYQKKFFRLKEKRIIFKQKKDLAWWEQVMKKELTF